jgi:5-methylcytosine-specific restriction endonuclease McrA
MARSFSDKFYHSKAWKNVRHEVLRRDLFTCRDCHSRANEVHHIIELTPDNINDINISLNHDNLISLCHDCHTKITKGYTGDITDGYIFDDNGQVIQR